MNDDAQDGTDEAFALLEEIDPDWGDLVERVSLILALHNPVGAFCGPNIDEYGPEAADIAAELDDCETPFDVQELVHAVFVHWFEVPDDWFDEFAGIAGDLWTLTHELD